MKPLKSIINLYLLEFTLNSILRQKTKNIFIITIFSLLVFITTSVFQISNGLKNEALRTVESLPEITIQQLKNGRMIQINQNKVDELLQIDGVSYANSRVWGYYYFANEDVHFTIIGIDQFEEQYKYIFQKISLNYNFYDMNNSMVVGRGALNILRDNYFDKSFNFIKQNGESKEVKIIGNFDRDTSLETNDVMLMPKRLAYEILEIDKDMATDIVVKVKNIDEIETIASKIQTMYPECKVTSRDYLKKSYEEMFNYKGGLFLSIFIISLFTFFMIIYDKSSTLLGDEKREIGILKAIGWSTGDILKWKLYEGFIIAAASFLFGVISSFFYVYILKAPILKDLFLGFSNLKPDFNIPFELNFEFLMIVFLICVPIYMAATIFPSWKVSIFETEEVLR